MFELGLSVIFNVLVPAIFTLKAHGFIHHKGDESEIQVLESRCPHLSAVSRVLRARFVRNRIRVFASCLVSRENIVEGTRCTKRSHTEISLFHSLSLSRGRNDGSVRPRLRPFFPRLYIVTIHRSYNPADLPTMGVEPR